MTSQVAICNLALGHIGVSREIASIAEQSAEASVFRRFYEPTRDELLRDFSWPFATKIAALGLVEEDPNDEWGYSYQYPSDCHQFRRILSGIRNDNRQSKIPYRIAYGDAGKNIFTDQPEAVGEWGLRITDPERFDADFVTAFSFLLAHRTAPALTAGDPFRLGDRAYQQFRMAIAKAQAVAALEEQTEEEPDSEFGRFR